MLMRTKQADAIGSGTADPSTAGARQQPVPPPSIENKPAPGQKGPAGMSGRTTYSRSNTGLPPVPDAGTMAQKNMAPRGMEFLPKLASPENMMTTTLIGKPDLNTLIKHAMEGSSAKMNITLEAAQQAANVGGTPMAEKKASAGGPAHDSIPTDLVNKLAAAANYVADVLEKGAAETTPGNGPGALQVSAPKSDGAIMDAGGSGQATSRNQPPKNPPMQKDPTRSGDPSTGLQTNDSMQHGEQPVEPISNEGMKAAAIGGMAAGQKMSTLEGLGLSQKGRTWGQAITDQLPGGAARNKNRMIAAAQGNKTAGVANNLIAMGLLKVAADESGSVVLTPTHEAVKEALVSPEGGMRGYMQSGTLGGAARGAIGQGMGGAVGGLGGAALGGAAGTGLGALAGAGFGAATGLGAGTGAVLGGAAGGLGGIALGGSAGRAYGKAKGYSEAMRPALQKRASARLVGNLMAMGLSKIAEDAINPAKISGKGTIDPAKPPATVSASEEGVPKEPSDVNRQKSMISSSEAAINYTKRQAKQDPKSDVGDVVTEPALTSSTDTVLQKALDNDGGNKLSSADPVRVAAARSVLNKLASKHKTAGSAQDTYTKADHTAAGALTGGALGGIGGHMAAGGKGALIGGAAGTALGGGLGYLKGRAKVERDNEGKKEKKSMMGGATPQSASGFNASSAGGM